MEQIMALEVLAPPKPTAAILHAHPLILGVEAEEFDIARGDASEEFSDLLSTTETKQAFRFGRVQLPAGLATTVPACAKVIVRNDSEVTWPEATAVQCILGDSFGFGQMQLGALQPGEVAEIVMDLTLPTKAEAARTRSGWAIVDPATDALLGPILLFEVIWM